MVKPDWGKPPIQYDAAFAPEATPARIPVGGGELTKGPLPHDVVTVLVDFANAMGSEFEGMMVHRGFDIMRIGKFEDMTYPQKTACNLALKPEVHLSLISQRPVAEIEEVSATAILRYEIILNIVEPLSNEKLFTKRLESQSDPFQFLYKYKVANLYNKKGEHTGYERESISWDNRAPRLANALTKFYNDIMENSWKYFSPEEMTVLKKHSDEIRKKKVF